MLILGLMFHNSKTKSIFPSLLEISLSENLKQKGGKNPPKAYDFLERNS
jgi:hypothetical protein